MTLRLSPRTAAVWWIVMRVMVWALPPARAGGAPPAALVALEAVRGGKAAGLLVAKMDRLSRSVVDGAGLMERAAREGWALHFADLDIDTSTPAGEMAANIIISGSQYERRLISQRTRDALAAKRARGERLGAAPALPLQVTRRIVIERREGRTFQAIAEGLELH